MTKSIDLSLGLAKNVTCEARSEALWKQLVNKGMVWLNIDGDTPFSFVHQQYNWYAILHVLIQHNLVTEYK